MRIRTPLLLAAAAVSALLLAGCSAGGSASGSTSASGCSAPASGSASSAVHVKGAKVGSEPKVTFSSPLKVKGTQRSTVIQGKGAAAKKTEAVDVAISFYNGSTGKKLAAEGYGKNMSTPFTIGDPQALPALTDATECARPGSRTVTIGTAKAMFGQAPPSGSGLKAGDSLILVTDVIDVVPEKADGTPVAPKPGFPTVKLAPNGKPTVTIAAGTPAPAQTEIEELKQGSGATVASGDTVTVQYQGLNLRTGKIFDQSWGRGLFTTPTGGVVAGFSKALVGQKVGSQVEVLIPPVDGYGSQGQAQAGIEGTDTLVFVIDIVKDSPASASAGQ